LGIFLQAAAGAGDSDRTTAEPVTVEVDEQLAAVLAALRQEVAAVRLAGDCLLACLREHASACDTSVRQEADTLCPHCGMPQ
jgi:hypothetical protein